MTEAQLILRRRDDYLRVYESSAHQHTAHSTRATCLYVVEQLGELNGGCAHAAGLRHATTAQVNVTCTL
jgi:hypothetical protein